MKNKEKYAKEILDIVCNNGEVAMDKTTKKLNDCKKINCDECYFSDNTVCGGLSISHSRRVVIGIPTAQSLCFSKVLLLPPPLNR